MVIRWLVKIIINYNGEELDSCYIGSSSLSFQLPVTSDNWWNVFLTQAAAKDAGLSLVAHFNLSMPAGIRKTISYTSEAVPVYRPSPNELIDESNLEYGPGLVFQS